MVLFHVSIRYIVTATPIPQASMVSVSVNSLASTEQRPANVQGRWLPLEGFCGTISISV